MGHTLRFHQEKMSTLSKSVLLGLILSCACLLVLIMLIPKSLKPGAPLLDVVKNESLLSIQMVIIPFLDYVYHSSEKAVLERLADYKLSLKKNLAHPHVERIHLLTTNYTETVERFKEFMQNEKILVAQVKSVDVARDPWEYISNNLVGKSVMYSNADVYLGRGFEQVDALKLKQNNIMYAVSRHLAPEYHRLCNKASKQYFLKDECAKYHNSHDIFLFYLHHPLPEELFEKLNFHAVKHGLEGRIIWLFSNVLKYCVLNPCSILNIFHYHCSHLRTNIHIKRIPQGNKYTGKASPTNNMLHCVYNFH